ncbi:hypothetical protein ACFV1L_10225 [Kitasatospora sp. NPDC059646]|uniref:hypothetical protein n=1 Tax=Kitasatospora sp. NPDC059646 TaxID=3346893 RepID=UPI00369FF94D
MTHEQQAAYWKHHARRHEQRASQAPTAEQVAQWQADAAELATRKAAELTETQRLQAEKDAAEQRAAQAQADAAAATRRALVLEVAGSKGLTPAQAERLQGSTREELEADADALREAFGGTGPAPSPPLSGGQRGGDVGGSSGSLAAGADLWRARNPKN